MFLFPNARWVEGKSAVAAVLKAPPDPFGAGITLTWTPVFTDVSADASVGYSFGNTTVTRPGRTPLQGQYIAFWRKQAGGRWAVEAWNMSPASSPPGEPPDLDLPPHDSAAAPPPVDMAAEAAALMAVDAAFSKLSVSRGQAEAFGTYADPHAVVLGGGNPDFVVGRDAIIESRRGAPGTLSWVPVRGGVGPLGDLGWSVGEYTYTLPDRTAHGKYLSVWRKQADGEWKFVQDAGSGNPAPE